MSNDNEEEDKKKEKEKVKRMPKIVETEYPESTIVIPVREGDTLIDPYFSETMKINTADELASPDTFLPIHGFGKVLPDPSDYLNIFTVPASSATLGQQIELHDDIAQIKIALGNALEELEHTKKDKKQNEKKLQQVREKHEELVKKENLRHLLSRVNEEARKKLFDSKDFVELFESNKMCKVVVMSIDIRRSTELMLKAKEPLSYAKFITSLCKRMTDIILYNYGIFDKFTGDGILAFFPDFYSGSDAALYSLKAATECHSLFDDHYEKNRHCFSTVLSEVGLGIGIDFGDAYLAKVNNELTVVGEPVVYACRFSGAESGETYLNPSAYEEVKKKYGDYCKFSETHLDLKHEGKAVAYKVELNFEAVKFSSPDWDKLIEDYK